MSKINLQRGKLTVLRGAGNDNRHQVDGLTAEVLNKHYADISTDYDYRAPRSKHTAVGQISSITEMDTFWILDTLRPTATGLDGIPAWFLQIGASVFAAPLAQLFNQSMGRSCAKSVKNSSHHSDTQSTKANSYGGLQADFNNAGPFVTLPSHQRHRPPVTACVMCGLRIFLDGRRSTAILDQCTEVDLPDKYHCHLNEIIIHLNTVYSYDAT